ncbi:N-acetylmuramoyl-L-alanine amidase [Intestinibacter sp.]|uniref:N-acetylmuramoyl-L-alanine amidase n=1 Tax=Intestinibacter sp. TaxID=1965304 RepID=UPI002A9170A2|nr:N-acetylmuramoyl-L-alanine amidase [Intestinibacter sp.]MDY5212210.1 N-acetylmuramoyl-L-alanine amidase [Intestinibacter sp.]
MTKKRTNNPKSTPNKGTRTNTSNKRPQTRTAQRPTKPRKNKRQKGLHRKKSSIKRKKQLIVLVVLIAVISIVGFIGKKTYDFVSNIWPNVISLKNSMTGGAIDTSHVNTDEQYDVSDEKEATLQVRHNVFIDVGCGGNETGYITDDKTKEKDLNLVIAKKVAKELNKQEDINVILSRQEDIYMSSDERKSLAEGQEAEVFVSIHMAAESSGKATGVETIYSKDAKDGSGDFASLMQTSIVAFVKAENRGTNTYDMSVLRDNSMPSIYIQCGFLSNSTEEKNLKDETYQNELAKGIAQGILTYIDAKK